jgi:Cu(I)/Ag(I) efflux system protein CusF
MPAPSPASDLTVRTLVAAPRLTRTAAGKRTIMTTLHRYQLALAGFILLALPACANSAPMATSAMNSAPVMGVDLGPSSRVVAMSVAMTGAGHEAMRPGADGAQTGNIVPVHDDGGDAHGTGTVNAVDAAQHKINLSHGPIQGLGWPAMTMDFPVAAGVDLSRIKPGSRVSFSLEKNSGGMYEVQSVQPAGGK